MLKNAFFFAGAAVALALYGPQLLVSFQNGPAPSASRQQAAVAQQAEAPTAAPTDGFGQKSIAADAGGQYSLDVLVAGQNVHMLVDTGATMVVISAALADRIGLSAEAGRKWKVHTANGDSLATEATLPSVDLGSVYMKDVPALIADRSAGDVNLLGASFLKRLSSVETHDGVLTLRQ